VFAGLTWYERSLASAFFATPPSASFEEVCCPLILLLGFITFWFDYFLVLLLFGFIYIFMPL